jgi:hypothetical protein
VISEARRARLAGEYDFALDEYNKLLESLVPLGDLWRIGNFQEEVAEMLMERSSPGDDKLALGHLKKAIEVYRTADLTYYEENARKKLETLSATPA